MNCCCSGDETLKLHASVRHGSNSSDEDNEGSLDVSAGWSDSDNESPADSDGDIRQEHRAAQVCALY